VSIPPAWATLDLLTDAIGQAARAVQVRTPAAPRVSSRSLTWGGQLDVRPVTPTGELTDTKVAGYVAKYATGWGEPIYPDTVTSLMTKLIAAHNQPDDGPRPTHPLPHARLHDLRHIHATTLLLSGVPVHVVAARLGHADPAITLRVYAHVIRTAEAAAADIFAEAVKAA
jgi:integrase